MSEKTDQEGKEGILPYPRTEQQKAATAAINRMTETVDSTNEIMRENISKVHERGEKLQELDRRAEALQKEAFDFSRKAAQMDN